MDPFTFNRLAHLRLEEFFAEAAERRRFDLENRGSSGAPLLIRVWQRAVAAAARMRVTRQQAAPAIDRCPEFTSPANQ